MTDVLHGQVTENFRYSEFKPKKAKYSWRPETDYQHFMLHRLIEQLQIVRTEFDTEMTVTSGVRTLGDYKRLKKAGYNPSVTSDHYCGNTVKVPKWHKKYKLFGPYYSFSVGAADVVMDDMGNVFKEAIHMNETMSTLDFGQIIWERDDAKGSEWIHFANNPAVYFNDHILQFLRREPYLITEDGGKTYHKYEI